MITLVLQVRRLVRAVLTVVAGPQGRALVVLVASQLVTGTIFYWSVEGWSVLDSLYFSVIVLMTIGLGDLAPVTAVGKVFTMVYALVGVGLLAAFVTVVASQVVRRDAARPGEAPGGGTAAASDDAPAP